MSDKRDNPPPPPTERTIIRPARSPGALPAPGGFPAAAGCGASPVSGGRCRADNRVAGARAGGLPLP